jgi:hypothetical protein
MTPVTVLLDRAEQYDPELAELREELVGSLYHSNRMLLLLLQAYIVRLLRTIATIEVK